MSRTYIQCVHCGEDVELFIDGTIVNVTELRDPLFNSKKGQVVEGFTEGFLKGMDESYEYEWEECPFCDGKFEVVIEPEDSGPEFTQGGSNNFQETTNESTSPNSTQQNTQPIDTQQNTAKIDLESTPTQNSGETEPYIPDSSGETKAFNNKSTSQSKPEKSIFVEIEGGDTISRRLEEGERLSIGRSDVAAHLSSDKRRYISGEHVEFIHKQSGYVEVRDADSSNGTTMNGRDISNGESHELSNDATFSLANDTIIFKVRVE